MCDILPPALEGPDHISFKKPLSRERTVLHEVFSLNNLTQYTHTSTTPELNNGTSTKELHCTFLQKKSDIYSMGTTDTGLQY